MPRILDRSVPRLADSGLVTPQQQVTRRRFLGAAAATAGGILLPGARGFGANTNATQSEYPSTDHFWYRLQPEGPYIDSQRDNKAFGFGDNKSITMFTGTTGTPCIA